MSTNGVNFDYSIPSTVVVSMPPASTVSGCFHATDEIRKRLQRSTRPLKLCVFRSLPGLPFVSTVGSSGSAGTPRQQAATAQQHGGPDTVENIARWDRLLQHFRRFKFVTVAVLDGVVDDVAFSFALACDFIVGTSAAALAPFAGSVAGETHRVAMGTSNPNGTLLMPFWSLASLAMHVGVANAQRFLTSKNGMPHSELLRAGILLEVVPDSSLETIGREIAHPLLDNQLLNRRGRTHMQTRNGLVASFSIKGAEHIGHCLAVLNVNVDAALESDPQIVYAAPSHGTDSVALDVVSPENEATYLTVTFPPDVALEGLGTAMLFTLLNKVKTTAAEHNCGRVVFRFELPAATAESVAAAAPHKLVFSAEVETLMEKESSGKKVEGAAATAATVAGASASNIYKDMRDLQIISVKAFTRWEKFLHSIRTLPFVTIAQLKGSGIASSQLMQFVSMCDLLVAGNDDEAQEFTICGGGSGQLTPQSFLFRIAKSGLGLARARALVLLKDSARTAAFVRDHLAVPGGLDAAVLGAAPRPHAGFLSSFRKLLQEACHESVPGFLRQHAKARQRALGITEAIAFPDDFRAASAGAAGVAHVPFFELKERFGREVPATPLLHVAIEQAQLPPASSLNSDGFAASFAVFLSSNGLLSLRFKTAASSDDGPNEAPALTLQAILELVAVFDALERLIASSNFAIEAVAITLPEGGFAQEADAAGSSNVEAEQARVLLAHLQLLVLRCSVPTYACLSGTVRGDALEIALACDYRLGTPTCAFGAPLGGVASQMPGALFIRLARSIGHARLNRLLFSNGNLLDAAELRSFGLLQQGSSPFLLLGSSVDAVQSELTDGITLAARVLNVRRRRLIDVVPQLSCRQTALGLEEFNARTAASRVPLAAASKGEGGAGGGGLGFVEHAGALEDCLDGLDSPTAAAPLGKRVRSQRRLALHFDDETKIPVIVLDRATAQNRLDTLMVNMLSQLVDHLEEHGYESVVIRAQDPQVFCAGIDASDPSFDPAISVAALNAVFDKLDEASFVSIALVEGDCHGAGFELAMSCDVRVAGPKANFWYLTNENTTKHATSNMRERIEGVLESEDVLRVLDGRRFTAAMAQKMGVVNYLESDPYTRAIAFAQSFMQKAIQSPAEESKAFAASVLPAFRGSPEAGEYKHDDEAAHTSSKVSSSKRADLSVSVAAPSSKSQWPTYNASLLSIATAVPPNCLYTQAQIAEMMQITDPTLKRLFGASHIRSRNLAGLKEEQQMDRSAITQGFLLSKHLKFAKILAKMTIPTACERAGISLSDVEYLVITSSTGFVLPPLTAHVSELLGLQASIQRTDIVGMGCHAGLNGMRSAANWVTQRANHGKYAVLACIEVCSAEYVWDPETMQNRSCLGIAVTNSLFGDGASACVLTCNPGFVSPARPRPQHALGASPAKVQRNPSLLGFESYLIPNSLRSMFMDWQDSSDKYSFLVMPEAPYLIGLCIPRMINKLLARFDLPIEDVSHWIVHSGGKKVIDQIVYTLGITADDVRHTVDSLEIAGNVSSGAFLFAYSRLVEEQTVRRGDYGMFITMGPGAGLEACLFRC